MSDQGSLVGLCLQDYKSLCAAVNVCATLVNTIQTRREHFDRLDINSSTSWAKISVQKYVDTILAKLQLNAKFLIWRFCSFLLNCMDKNSIMIRLLTCLLHLICCSLHF